MCSSDLRFDDSFLVDALKDQLVQREGPDTGPYTGWAVDSRKVTDDAIFAALAGSQSDGHQFIAAACAKGAKAVLCRTDWTGHPPAGVTFYRVKDPFEALRLLGRKWRSKLQCPVIAVAGSVGKTTTKEMTAALLRGKFSRVTATKGSENGFLGIPLTLLRTPLDCQALVVEIGIDAPGAMAQHLEMVRPTVGLVTAIAPEHLEQLHDLETVAKEESLCLEWIANHGGPAIINGDDPFLSPLRHSLHARHPVAFGLDPGV